MSLTDGNEVNHKFFKQILMSYILKDSMENPFSIPQTIFLAFDTVHLFKCFYTNFLSKKVFVFPKFDKINIFLEARFADIKMLYDMTFANGIQTFG